MSVSFPSLEIIQIWQLWNDILWNAKNAYCSATMPIAIGKL